MGKVVVFNERDTRRGHAGAGTARRGHSRRLCAWRLGDALRHTRTIRGSTGKAPNVGALLLGRRTYEDFFAVWPNRHRQPLTEVLNNTQKYVASTTLQEPLPWRNSMLLKGNVSEAVGRLKGSLTRIS